MSSAPPPPTPEKRASDRKARRRTALIAAGGFLAMLALSFAAIPLYSMFCKATGYAGTTRRATAAPHRQLAQTVEVRFDTTVAPGADLVFQPDERLRTVHLGETAVVFFKIINPTDKPIRAVATYNVSPDQAGAYFKKLECFCFQQQTFQAHQTIELPVVFFVDPDMAGDRNTRDIQQITLSYTYFNASADAVKTVTAKAEEPIGRVVASP